MKKIIINKLEKIINFFLNPKTLLFFNEIIIYKKKKKKILFYYAFRWWIAKEI